MYSVRKGRIRAVAVVTRRLAARRSLLRVAMRRLRKAPATQAGAERKFVANPKAVSLRGATLAGTQNTRANDALRLLCKLPPR